MASTRIHRIALTALLAVGVVSTSSVALGASSVSAEPASQRVSRGGSPVAGPQAPSVPGPAITGAQVPQGPSLPTGQHLRRQSAGAGQPGGLPQIPGGGSGPGNIAPTGPGGVTQLTLPPGTGVACAEDLNGAWTIVGPEATGSVQATLDSASGGLFANQAADGILYQGQCSGTKVDLNVYRNNAFIGTETGTIKYIGSFFYVEFSYTTTLGSGSEVWF
jgi:hypothetical protein